MARTVITDAPDLKARVRDFWQEHPCGAKFTELEPGSAAFFQAVDAHRYATEGHILEVVDFPRWRDREVLEIGCGVGSDAALFARSGARYTGIDLTDRSVELVSRRFEVEGLAGDVLVADAEQLPFDDGSFDLVYSHGVLHHTPDTQRAIHEARRVLRTGGVALVMLYHKGSYNYRVNIMGLRRIGARFLAYDWGVPVIRRLTGEDRARLEQLQRAYRSSPRLFLGSQEFLNQNTDGAGNPLARVYSRSDAAEMFREFASVRTEVHFLNRRWIPLIGRVLPRRLERRLASRYGWHLWIIATK